MTYSGNILKMRTELNVPVKYYLPLGDQEVFMNELIGNEISLSFEGQINCVSCGRKTKTSFAQGFCYNCMQTVPEASETIMRPELSKAHFGIARNMEWAQKHDLIDHYVYLAVSGDLKVGVTRQHQIPTRWIDQGASSAIRLARTPNRHIAGIIEVFLKNYFSDKTNWRSMLKNELTKNINLVAEKQKAYDLLPAELKQYYSDNDELVEIIYPVSNSPEKLNNTTFDKEPVIKGILDGIKGQYLLFNNGKVLNVRKHNGYYIELSV